MCFADDLRLHLGAAASDLAAVLGSKKGHFRKQALLLDFLGEDHFEARGHVVNCPSSKTATATPSPSSTEMS